MKVKQIVSEAADQQQVYRAHQEMREKNPQYAAEVAKLPPLIRGIGPEAQKHNQMVWGAIAKILQKYKAIPEAMRPGFTHRDAGEEQDRKINALAGFAARAMISAGMTDYSASDDSTIMTALKDLPRLRASIDQLDDRQYNQFIDATFSKAHELAGQQEVSEDGEQRMSRAAKGNKKYGKDGMQALRDKAMSGASEKEMDATRDEFNKYDESLEEGVMSEIHLEMGEMMDKYIQRYKSGHMDSDHLMHMMDKASNILARRHDMEPEQAHQFISDYVEQADNEEVVDEIMGGEAEIVKSDDTGVTYKDTATGVVTTLPPTMAGALAPNPQNPNQFTLNPQAVAPGDNQGKPKGPPIGAKVTIAPMSETRQSRTASSSNADLDAMLRIAGLK